MAPVPKILDSAKCRNIFYHTFKDLLSTLKVVFITRSYPSINQHYTIIYFIYHSLFHFNRTIELFFRPGWWRGWIHILTLFLSLSPSTSLSPLDSPWRNILSPTAPGPISHLSIPPQRFCQTSLDAEQTIQAYNAFNRLLLLIETVQFTTNKDAIFRNRTENPPTVTYLIKAESLTAATEQCKLSGNLFQIYSKHWSHVKYLLDNYATTYKTDFAIQLDVLEDKPITLDGHAITLQGQTFNKDHPFLVFTPTGQSLGSPSDKTTSIICSQTDDKQLPNQMNIIKTAVDTQIIALQTSAAQIRQALHQTIPKFSNFSLQTSTNQSAQLIRLKKADPRPNCIRSLISITPTISNYSLPLIVTPINLEISTLLLEDRLVDLIYYTTKVQDVLQIMNSQDKDSPTLVLSYSLESYSDLFNLLPSSSPAKSLLLILISTVTGTVLFLVICLCLFLLLARRDSRLLRRTPDEQNTTFNLQLVNSHPTLPPTAPMLSLQ